MSAPKVTIILIVLAVLASLAYIGLVSRQAAQAGVSRDDVFQTRSQALEREYREAANANGGSRR